MAGPVDAAPRADRPANLMNVLVACKAESDDARRLACYDAAAGRLAEATAKGDVKVLDREDVRETRRSLFGFDMPRLPFFKGDDSAVDTPAEIEAVIADVSADGLGKFTMAMVDGSVWRTTEQLPRDPRAGGKVRLKRGAIGNYFIGVNGGRLVRAIRVR